MNTPTYNPEVHSGFYWWIDEIRVKHGAYYRYHVAGRIEDSQHPDFARNGEEFSWSVPTLQSKAYVFALRVIS